MIIKDTSFKHFLAKKLYHLSMRLQNSGSVDMRSNGELNALKNIIEQLKNKKDIVLFECWGKFWELH